MEKKYINKYIEKENYVELYIYGLKHEARLKIEKSDVEAISKLHWGLMSVGRKENQKIIPYTTINRTSVPLGRWLLEVDSSDKRVEHYDRDNHNFLKNNLYVVGKQGYKKQVSKNGKDIICGVFEIKQKNGKITGYKVQYTNPMTSKKEWVSFNLTMFETLENAKREAILFKQNLIDIGVRQTA